MPPNDVQDLDYSPTINADELTDANIKEISDHVARSLAAAAKHRPGGKHGAFINLHLRIGVPIGK
jgi:hypothetical protein